MPTNVSKNISRNLMFKETDKDLLKYLRRNLPINNGISSPGTVDVNRVERIELDLLSNPTTVVKFKELLYTGDFLTGIDIWTNSAKVVKLYSQVFNYTGDTLSSIVTTRISDSFSYTKTFTYNIAGVLTSIEYN